GLAGALATPAATLWALGAGVVTAVVCGAAGRTALARTLGWLTGVAATAALGLVAGLAADLAVRSAAFAVLAAGALALGGSAGLAVRHRPELRSWTAYAPALLAGFGPSLAAVLVSGGDPVRRLALGVGALAVVLGGAAGRRQAPVVVGGAVLVLLALHETVLL